MMGILRSAAVLVAPVLLASCAVRLGGPGPEEYSAVALSAAAGASAAETVAQLRSAGAEIVLLSADRDSAWFAEVASGAGLSLSGPGRTGPRAMGFMTNLEILGDTSLVLPVQEGGRIHMHDALYRVDRARHIDLMMVRLEDTPNLRAAVRTLLDYVSTDVGASAALLLGIEASTPQLADSVAVLMRATLAPATECVEGDASVTLPLQLLYGPSARLGCRSARVLPGPPPAIQARVVVGR